MKLTANDTLHVSSVKADNLLPGEEFEVSDDMGRQLVAMGRATEVKAKAEPANKAEPAAPENKAAPAPEKAPVSAKSVPAKASTKKKGK